MIFLNVVFVYILASTSLDALRFFVDICENIQDHEQFLCSTVVYHSQGVFPAIFCNSMGFFLTILHVVVHRYYHCGTASSSHDETNPDFLHLILCFLLEIRLCMSHLLLFPPYYRLFSSNLPCYAYIGCSK